MSRRLLLPSAGIGVFALLGAVSPLAQPAAETLKVGVVDVQQVMAAYKGLAERVRGVGERSQQEMDALSSALNLDALRARLDTTDPNSKEGARAQLNVENAQRRLQMESRLLNRAYEIEVRALEVDAYGEVQQIVDQVAAALKLDLVLREHTIPDGVSKGGEREVWGRRVVMHHRADLDITPLVIARLPK